MAISPGDRMLVTGAGGFIGSAVTRALLARGAKVVALLQPGVSTANLEGLAVEPVVADLRDPAAVVGRCQRVPHDLPRRRRVSVLGTQRGGLLRRQRRRKPERDRRGQGRAGSRGSSTRAPSAPSAWTGPRTATPRTRPLGLGSDTSSASTSSRSTLPSTRYCEQAPKACPSSLSNPPCPWALSTGRLRLRARPCSTS